MTWARTRSSSAAGKAGRRATSATSCTASAACSASTVSDATDRQAGTIDPDRLTYTWASPLDPLQQELAALVEAMADEPIPAVHDAIRVAVGLAPLGPTEARDVPRIDEPWFCCAEPTELQLRAI